jgi:hypothetical protein
MALHFRWGNVMPRPSHYCIVALVIYFVGSLAGLPAEAQVRFKNKSPRECFEIIDNTIQKLGRPDLSGEVHVSIRNACIEGRTDDAVAILLNVGRSKPAPKKRQPPAEVPRIARFSADPPVIRGSELVTIRWHVDDAKEVWFRRGNEGWFQVGADDGTVYRLDRTTDFDLSARSPAGERKQRITVRYKSGIRVPPPRRRPSDGCENLSLDQQAKCGG